MGAAPAPPCSPGQICTGQFGTIVNGTNLYFSTATTISSDNKGSTTLNYWNGSEWLPAATSSNASGWTPTQNTPLSSTAVQSLTSGDLGKNASAQTSTALDKAGVPKTTQNNVVPGATNTATNTGTGTTDGGSVPVDYNEGFIKGTREKYGDFKYPINLKAEHQDCIKFTIQKYVPSLASSVSTSTPSSSSSSTPSPSDTKPKEREILGSITLPIPAGITDSNTVNWQSGELNELKQQLAMPTLSFLTGGTKSAGAALEQTGENAQQMVNSGDARNAVASLVAKSALRVNDIQQRAFGTIFNNNLELLFNGPSLRSFTFTFKLSPREPDEAKEIMLIIRSFKQAMATKRSSSTLLLKTPHTFKIQYLTSNKDHPYLNKFKECALTGFNVDYTPEGQYMTYMSSNINERSMISYVLSMSFQELEPVYDDEYGNETLDKKSIKNIGY